MKVTKETQKTSKWVETVVEVDTIVCKFTLEEAKILLAVCGNISGGYKPIRDVTDKIYEELKPLIRDNSYQIHEKYMSFHTIKEKFL